MNNENVAKRKMFNFEDKKEILKKTNFRCAHCGKQLDEHTMTIEHIFPIAKGGNNSKYNIIALCEDCNYKKSNSVYSVSDYYSYILDEYRLAYVVYNALVRTRPENLGKGLIASSSKMYTVINPMMARKIAITAKRNRKAAMELCSKFEMKLTLEKAYSGEAYNIASFLSKDSISKTGIKNELYNNEYEVLNAIKDGEVYCLRNSIGELYGVFIFIRTDRLDLDMPQIDNICSMTGMTADYIMTLAVLNVKVAGLLDEIMNDFVSVMVSKRILPITFGILSQIYHGKGDYMRLPLEINGVQGMIEAFTLSGLRDIIRAALERLDPDAEISEDLVDKMLSPDYKVLSLEGVEGKLDSLSSMNEDEQRKVLLEVFV